MSRLFVSLLFTLMIGHADRLHCPSVSVVTSLSKNTYPMKNKGCDLSVTALLVLFRI